MIPGPPHFRFEFAAWQRALPGVFEVMARTPQDPIWHAEGDVLTHTGMVCEALTGLASWRALGEPDRETCFLAALLHDVAKPECTREEGGRIVSPGHSRKGQDRVRRLLYRDPAWPGARPGPRRREQVAALVRHHGMPLWALEEEDLEFRLRALSLVVPLEWLALVAEADVRGRWAEDREDLLTRVELFREMAREAGCLDAAFPFPSHRSRLAYLRSEGAGNPCYDPHPQASCRVTVLSGLPASGKDHWVRSQARGRPVISLDQIREEFGVAPWERQEPVVQRAREQAREHLRAGRDFLWNATNVTRSLRQRVIGLLLDYRAEVELVYLEAPWEEILRRNAERPRPVPGEVLERLADKLEVPTPGEAHRVVWLDSSSG